MTDWNNPQSGIVGQPAPKATEAPDRTAPGETMNYENSGAPTPEEVAADVADRQSEIDAKRLAAGTSLPATAEPPPPPDPTNPGSVAPQGIERAAPISTDPAPQPEIPAPAPPPPRREPKHRMGAFLKIPGGFSGRVVQIYNSYEEVREDPDVAAAGGADQVVRGIRGKGLPSQEDQPFYRCRSNAADYDLVVGEMDAHLIMQGPDVPQ